MAEVTAIPKELQEKILAIYERPLDLYCDIIEIYEKGELIKVDELTRKLIQHKGEYKQLNYLERDLESLVERNLLNMALIKGKPHIKAYVL